MWLENRFKAKPSDKVGDLIKQSLTSNKQNSSTIDITPKLVMSSFDNFCLINACDLYTQKNKVGYGFETKMALLSAVKQATKKITPHLNDTITSKENLITAQDSTHSNKTIAALTLLIGVVFYLEKYTSKQQCTPIFTAGAAGLLAISSVCFYLSQNSNGSLQKAREKEQRVSTLKKQLPFFYRSKLPKTDQEKKLLSTIPLITENIKNHYPFASNNPK